MLENRGVDLTLHGRPAQCVSFRDERRHSCREILVVESRRGKAFDQQTVFSEHQHGVNAGALAQRCCEVSDVRY